MSVLVIGAGKMTEAILLGLVKKHDLSDWYVYSKTGISAQNLASKVNAKALASLEDISSPELVVIGCKPQQLKELALDLKGRFKNSLFVSVLAAISEKDQREILGVNELVRVMPNLPVRYGVGVSLIASTSAQKSVQKIQTLFSSCGEAIVVSEEELDELTLLTGSGPAFFYEFTKELGASFTSLNPEARERLARQVFLGSAISSKEEGRELSAMIDAVTSKGGVTIAVLEKWRELDLRSLVLSGIASGKKRTQELKALLRN